MPQSAHTDPQKAKTKSRKPKTISFIKHQPEHTLVHASTLAQINVRWNTKMPTSTYYADFADCVAIVIKAQRLLVFAHEKPEGSFAGRGSDNRNLFLYTQPVIALVVSNKGLSGHQT